MNPILSFVVHNFVLLCISLVMIFNAILSYAHNRRLSISIFAITGCCFLLALSYALQLQFKPLGYRYPVIILSILGYVLRPVCIYFFIQMNNSAYRGKYSFLLWVPLVINAIIYLLALIPGLESVVFTFVKHSDGTISFSGGPLRFTSHIIAFGYLIYLLYLSIFTLRANHIFHGLIIMVCAIFVTAAVLIETFAPGSADIEILNATIMVSTMTYYLYLFKRSVQIDTATGLFNRETFYRDLPRMTKSISGFIHYDINGLKYLNDNFGHDEGDRCISTIADNIESSIKKGMYAYRLGGDEFIVVVNRTDEQTIIDCVNDFKERMKKSKYYCSIGYSYKKDSDTPSDELIKEAEQRMYQDKAEFYKNAPFDRRKG